MYGLVLEGQLKNLDDALGRPATLSWTTATVIFNLNNRFKSLAKAIRINNEDGTNTLRYRLNGNIDTVELAAGARDPIATWIEQIEIIPNGATGVGTMQLDLVPIDDAYVRGRG